MENYGSYDVFLTKLQGDPLAVLIQGFRTTVRGNSVEVHWEVWSDEPLESFVLYRSEDDSHFTVLVEGPFIQTIRSFVDMRVVPGKTYHYQLVIRSRSGRETRSPEAIVTVPAVAATLAQNRPNPFNPVTTIEYVLLARTRVALGVFDATGMRVARLDQGVRPAGVHRVEWDGRDARGRSLGSGVYIYRLEGVSGPPARRMVLIAASVSASSPGANARRDL